MSWTEAFRSISRLFSRSRPADSADSERQAEADGSTCTCSVPEDGADQTPGKAAAQCSGSTGGHEGVSAAPRAPTAPPAHTLPLQTSRTAHTHTLSSTAEPTGGQWVAYEFPLFRGRQVLLGPGECAEWAELSSWGTLGSIRPLQQPRGYLQLRNRALGLVLTTEDLPDGSLPAKLLLRPAERSLHTQRWILRDGLLKNTKQMGCLSVIGAKACAGAPVALWEEHGRTNQRWSITEDGHIHTHLDHSLVLDLTVQHT